MFDQQASMEGSLSMLVSSLSSDHTYRHFREGWFPALVGDRHTHEDWVQKGGKTLGDRANERVREILASHILHALIPPEN